MRVVLTLAASVLISASAYADLIARAGKDELRLMNGRCTDKTILAEIKAEFHAQFRSGQVTLDGKTTKLCWIDTLAGHYYVVFSDGNSHIFPISIFI